MSQLQLVTRTLKRLMMISELEAQELFKRRLANRCGEGVVRLNALGEKELLPRYKLDRIGPVPERIPICNTDRRRQASRRTLPFKTVMNGIFAGRLAPANPKNLKRGVILQEDYVQDTGNEAV